MPVFYRDKIKILYVHVPKTGGTAIEMFFQENGFRTAYLDRGTDSDNLNPIRRCSPQHMHAAMLSTFFALSGFSYVFMTVRHPIDRLLSEYKMRRSERPNLPDINAWLSNSFRRYGDDPYMLDNHLRPQAEFWLPGAEVFRQEDGFGPAWAGRLGERVGYNFEFAGTGVAMRFDGAAASRADLSVDSLAAIEHFYRGDYSLFGY